MAKATTSGYADLSRALYGALNRAPLTTTLGCAVYDYIPQSATPPVVRIDVIPGEPWDTLTRAGHQHLAEIHVFTTYAGAQQMAHIVDAVIGMLDAVALAVVGQQVYTVQRMAHRAADDEVIGGVRTAHRILPFRVWIAEGERP
jgi:hypothetical protein